MPGRRISFTVSGYTGVGVPVDLLAAKLRSLQRYIEEVAVRSRPPGVTAPEAREASQLAALSAEPGSLIVNLELPAIPWEAPGRALVDLGEHTADQFEHSMDAISSRDLLALSAVFPEPGNQLALLRAARALLPDVEASYGLALGGGEWHASFGSAHQEWIRDRLEALEAEQGERQVRTVTGTLVSVDTSGRLEVGIRRDGLRRVTKCTFTEDLMPSVADISIGEVVEAEGIADVTPTGRVRALRTMKDIRCVQLGFQPVAHIDVGDRRFVLSPDLLVTTSYRDGMIWRECPSLEVWACGATRAGARLDFAREFARIYDHYTRQDDDRLSEGARELKRQLHALVVSEERVEP